MPITGVGGMPPDELLRTTGSSTTPYETYTTTTNETGVYVGEHELFVARVPVTNIGVSTGATTDYSAVVKLQDSATGEASTGYTDMGISLPAINSALGDSFAVSGAAVEFAQMTSRTRTGRPYVRPVITMAGTNPSVTLAVVIAPAPAGLMS